MGSFTDDEIDKEALDWRILRDGGISLYMRFALLDTDVRWLQSHGYKSTELDCGLWVSEASMHEALASALSFPDYYGRNLDALTECMSEDFTLSPNGGFALVLKRFDRFAAALHMARNVVDVFAIASRYHMLRGRRFIVLIQSDDPRISFTELGGVNAEWNSSEWLLKNRLIEPLSSSVSGALQP